MDSPLSDPAPLKTNSLALWGILGLAFSLRLVGIQFGLPYLYHADEPIVVNHALAYGVGDFNPHFFKIPPLVSYLLFVTYGFYFLGGRMLGLLRAPEDFEHLFYKDPSSFYLMGRFIFGVLAGTATVYFFYRLILKWFGHERALLSAFLLAVSFLHVRDSHYIYLDTPLVLILVLGFFFVLSLVSSKNRLSLHLFNGAMIGLATAAKYNGAALAIPYLYVTLFTADKKRILGFCVLSGGAAAVTYFLLNPYSLLDFGFFWKEIAAQAKSHGGVGWTHHLKYSLIEGVGPPLFFLGLGGMIRAANPWNPTRAPFIIFLLAYYALLALAGQPYDRYVLPLLPFLVFFAADFVLTLAERFKAGRRLLLGILIGGLALPSLVKSILFDRLLHDIIDSLVKLVAFGVNVVEV